MKKIAAFITAAMLFIVVVVSVHYFAGSRIEANNREFGTWINSKKDLSYSAIASNLHDDTFMMLGSSELQHGEKTPYHPTSIFRQAGLNVMCIGAAGNQCFPHAVTMAALAPELKSKKVALILSPTWFSKGGIDGSKFAARFSESQYQAMLKNDSLSPELKDKLIERTEELLEISPAMKENAERDARVLINGTDSIKDNVNYYMHNWIASEKEKISVGLMWKISGHKNNRKYEREDGEVPDWESLKEQADEEFKKECSNEFAMKDKFFNSKFKPVLKKLKDGDKDRSFKESAEYDDLKLFLDICKDQGVEVMLVLLPINGYWYDHTGFPKENRDVIVGKIHEIAEDYDAELCDFFGQCYTKGWLEDNTHPAGRGWVEINEKAYEFFTESQKING